MKILSFILLECLFVLCVYCQSTITKGLQKFTLKESKRMVQDTVIFKSVTAIPLEMSIQKYARIKISRIYFDEDTFFILDKDAEVISIYDKEGHCMKMIRKLTNGVQGYRELADICVDKANKELMVLSAVPSKILFYTYQGEFLREILLPTYYESITTDGKFIYLQDNNVIKGEKEIAIYTRNLQDKKEALEVIRQFKGRESHEYTPFTCGRMMTQDTIIHITQYFDNKIYRARKGNIYLEYILDFRNSTLPNALLERKMRPTEFLKICKEHNYISFITDVIENDKFLLFNTNVGLCVCSKQNGAIIKYDELLDSMTGYIINRIHAVGNTNNKMAVFWPLTFIKDSRTLPIKKTSFYNQLERNYTIKMPEVNDNHNGILIIYEF